MRAVIYSAYFGDKEPLNRASFGEWKTVERVIITDDPDLRAPHADRIIHDSLNGLDPARASRRGKLMPHRYFPEYDWSLYIDNNAELRADPAELFAAIARNPGSGFHCFKHIRRDCIYDEATVCIRLGKDDPEIIRRQMERFRAVGLPRHAGLITGTFLIREHNRPMLRELGERWFDTVLHGSRRDQLAFNYVAWMLHFQPDYLKGTVLDNPLMRWPVYTEDMRKQDFPPVSDPTACA